MVVKEESDDEIFEDENDEVKEPKNLEYQPNVKKEPTVYGTEPKTETINKMDIKLEDLGNDTEMLKKRNSINEPFSDKDDDLFVS